MPLRAPLRAASAAALALCLIAHTAAIPRDPSTRAAFRKANPCPSTGMVSGRCPGFVIDHRIALMNGGEDDTRNMQWLAIDVHRAKTRADFAECRASVLCKHRSITRARKKHAP